MIPKLPVIDLILEYSSPRPWLCPQAIFSAIPVLQMNLTVAKLLLMSLHVSKHPWEMCLKYSNVEKWWLLFKYAYHKVFYGHNYKKKLFWIWSMVQNNTRAKLLVKSNIVLLYLWGVLIEIKCNKFLVLLIASPSKLSTTPPIHTLLLQISTSLDWKNDMESPCI